MITESSQDTHYCRRAMSWIALPLLAALVFLLAACGSIALPGSDRGPRIEARGWPAADALFRRDKHWLGGDAATSVDLEQGRILWLFGDSFVDEAGRGRRDKAVMVRNSIAVQDGLDPASAGLSFYWGGRPGQPAAFFSGDAGWYWPGSGIRIRDRLLILWLHVFPDDNPLGFRLAGVRATLVDNPDTSPQHWHRRSFDLPFDDRGVAIGSGVLVRQGDYIHALGAHRRTHAVYLLRWRAADVYAGDLSRPWWWTGTEWESGAWPVGTGSVGAGPAGGSMPAADPPGEPLFTGGQMEFGVFYDPGRRCFFQVQADTFVEPGLYLRHAMALTGPWSPAVRFYRPPELERQGLVIYAGKLQPVLSRDSLVCTYMVNDLSFGRLLQDNSIYYPVFLKIDLE